MNLIPVMEIPPIPKESVILSRSVTVKRLEVRNSAGTESIKWYRMAVVTDLPPPNSQFS